MKSPILLIVLAVGLTGARNAGRATGEPDSPPLLAVDLSAAQPGKDLSRCLVGADCESWLFGGIFDYGYWLGEGRTEFARAVKESGLKVFRLASMSRFDFAGPDAARKLIKASRLKADPRSSALGESLFRFCQENGVKIIAMVNLPWFYDADTEQALNGFDHPEACARNAGRFARWVKDHGFSDTVVAWELGNEIYCWRDQQRHNPKTTWEEAKAAPLLKQIRAEKRPYPPELAQKWASVEAQAARAIKDADPTAKVAVSAVSSSGQAVVSLYARAISAGLGALGQDARFIDYLDVHHYGANAPSTHEGWYRALLEPNPNCQHFRYILTE